MSEHPLPVTAPTSLPSDPLRWYTASPRGSLLSDEQFGALEQCPEPRRFTCRGCGMRQFVLADARVTLAVKARWECECTRGPGQPAR